MACHRRKWKGVVKAALLAILYQVTHKWVGLETRVGLFTLRSLVYALRLLLSSYTACCVADRWSLHPGLVTSPLLLMASSTCGEDMGLRMVTMSRSSPHCWSAGTPSPPQDHLPLDCIWVPLHQLDTISTITVVKMVMDNCRYVIACCIRIILWTNMSVTIHSIGLLDLTIYWTDLSTNV